MNFWGLLVLLVSTLALCHGQSLSGYIDTKKLQTILEEGVKSKDISAVYYSVKGLKLLKAKIPDICDYIKNFKFDLNNVEQVFYLTNAASLSGCVNYVSPDVMRTSTQVLDKKDSSIVDLYHAINIQRAFGKGQIVNPEESLAGLVELLKKDDSITNYGYVFDLCLHIGCTSWTAGKAAAALAAADETDQRALHYEGGLPATSMLLTTILRTFKTLKKPAPLSVSQRYKFAEYLAGRGRVNTPRGAALLLEAALELADDTPSPINIEVKGRPYLTSESESIEFTVSDLLGRPVHDLKPEEVIAQSGTRLADDVVVLSKQPLIKKAGEPTTYVLNLSKLKSQYGVYKIVLSAGARSTTVNVAVLGELQVSSVEIGVGDVDGTISPKVTTLTYPNKLAEKLTADHLQKVSLKFTVRDKQSGKPLSVQQAFVLVQGEGADETVFVAEPDTAKTYKVDLNVGSLGKHLSGGSGRYSVSLALGDSAAAAPLLWPLADVHFNFGQEGNSIGEPKKSSKPRGPLPEISHLFRSPEPRPARLVSDIFAAMCAAPLLLLLALWAKLRVNLGHFPLSISALLFHLSLGGSLALYAVLWLKLSMFETVRYMLPLALLTFLSGHRLLRRLVQDKSR